MEVNKYLVVSVGCGIYFVVGAYLRLAFTGIKYGPNPGIYFVSQFLAYKTNASLQRHASALVVLNKHGKGYFQPLICFPSSADTCLLH